MRLGAKKSEVLQPAGKNSHQCFPTPGLSSSVERSGVEFQRTKVGGATLHGWRSIFSQHSLKAKRPFRELPDTGSLVTDR